MEALEFHYYHTLLVNAESWII